MSDTFLCIEGIPPMPTEGERETGRSLGEGVGMGELCSEYSSASDRVDRLTTEAREAKAAAVAAAASSTVPVWWFWWRVKVVLLVKVF